MADLIERELDAFPDPAVARIFFSAHGVPKSYVVEAGDPYKEEMVGSFERLGTAFERLSDCRRTLQGSWCAACPPSCVRFPCTRCQRRPAQRSGATPASPRPTPTPTPHPLPPQEECVSLIMRELERRGRPNPHTLAYQSRVGPVEWLKPYTDESIRCGPLLEVWEGGVN